MWRNAAAFATALAATSLLVQVVSAFVPVNGGTQGPAIQRHSSFDFRRATTPQLLVASSSYKTGLSAVQESSSGLASFRLAAIALAATLAGVGAIRRLGVRDGLLKGRRSRIVCYMHGRGGGAPSYNAPRQKKIRRLIPGGPVPGWTAKPLKQRVKQYIPVPVHFAGRLSLWGQSMREKRRICYNYNILERDLKIIMQKALQPMNEWPVERMLQTLESRLDCVLYRCGIYRTIIQARKMVLQLHIEVKSVDCDYWRVVDMPSMQLKPGDQFRIRNLMSKKMNVKTIQAQRKTPILMKMHKRVPEHLQWDNNAMEGMYVKPCHRFDLSMPVEEIKVMRWFVKRIRHGSVRRLHTNVYPWNGMKIVKRPGSGRPVKTVKNLHNMMLGVGLRRAPWGKPRRRPPCLWGRHFPLNNPYVTQQFKSEKWDRFYAPDPEKPRPWLGSKADLRKPKKP